MSTKRPLVLTHVEDAYPRVGEYVRSTGVTFKPAQVTGPGDLDRDVLVHLDLSDIEKLLGALPALYMFDKSTDAYTSLLAFLKALKEV